MDKSIKDIKHAFRYGDWYLDGGMYIVVVTGQPSDNVEIGVGETPLEAVETLETTPMCSAGWNPVYMALDWAAGAGWFSAPDELEEIENPETELPDREYTVEMRDDSGSTETETIEVDAGAPEEQEAAAIGRAKELAEEWAREGDWGEEGAIVNVGISVTDEDGEEIYNDSIDVAVEPDHDALIDAAGGDTSCDHDWTSEGEGGCDRNPGVWSLGGTTFKFASHCTKCGLHRTEIHYGSQRNPGEHDTVEYTVPDNDDEE